MAVLDILTAPDPRLKVKAEEVRDVSTVQTLIDDMLETLYACLLYTSPSPRDRQKSRMPSSA